MAKLKDCTAILILLTLLSCTTSRNQKTLQVNLKFPAPAAEDNKITVVASDPQYVKSNGNLYRLYTITTLVRVPRDSIQQLNSRKYAKLALWHKD